MAKKYFTPTKISENIRATPEGFLLCLSVPIARTGWMDYSEEEVPIESNNSDGLVKIHRDSKEVFRPQTIASFEGKPITIRHPNDFVNPKNWNYLAKGVVQNVRKSLEKDEDGEECLIADLLIQDEMAINLVKNGLREVSCGYEAEYEQTGEGKGEQTFIVGNHLALVEQGRAGSTYAINDEKGKVPMADKKLIDRLKAKLGAKVVDEAMSEEKEKSKDEMSNDELVSAVKDLMSRVEGFMEQKNVDEDKSEEKKDESKDEEEKKDDKAKDEDESEKEESKDEGAEMEERLKALEAAVAKLLKSKSGDEDEEESEDDMEESEDDDMSGGEEAEDAGEEGEEGEKSQKKFGDTKSRAEILAPGIKASADIKVKALTTVYGTKDGKAMLEQLNGGKKPNFDSLKTVDTLFVAASELLKSKRNNKLAGTKDSSEAKKYATKFEDFDPAKEVMTPEKMNELNAAHWAARK